MKGKFIAIYGINNIGKSTQAKLLVNRLNRDGHEAVLLKYPIYDLEPTGPRLNQILRSDSQELSEEELQTIFVQNRIDFEPKLIDMLEKGVTVVAEDYIGTGIAWGAAKGADLEWLEAINAPLLQPDLNILMHGNRFKHAQEDVHIHESDEALMKRCEEIFQNLAEKYGWERLMVMDGIELTFDQLWNLVHQKISL